VVGFRLPPLHPTTLSLNKGDTIIMATDGIENGFERDVRSTIGSQELADMICTKYSKSNDDALVLVARYLGRKRER
jgi:hypothetical protein